MISDHSFDGTGASVAKPVSGIRLPSEATDEQAGGRYFDESDNSS